MVAPHHNKGGGPALPRWNLVAHQQHLHRIRTVIQVLRTKPHGIRIRPDHTPPGIQSHLAPQPGGRVPTMRFRHHGVARLDQPGQVLSRTEAGIHPQQHADRHDHRCRVTLQVLQPCGQLLLLLLKHPHLPGLLRAPLSSGLTLDHEPRGLLLEAAQPQAALPSRHLGRACRSRHHRLRACPVTSELHELCMNSLRREA